MIGTLIPVTVFLALIWLAILPHFSGLAVAWELEALARLETQWEVFVFVLLDIALSATLFTLNSSHIRLYEGYPWRDTWWGRRRIGRYQRELDVYVSQQAGVRRLRAVVGQTPHDAELRRLQADAGRAQDGRFPKRSSVLPTRLGNVIRAFENYPRTRYGMSAVPLWPRLAGVLDAGHAAAIDNEKASFDFTVTSCSLAMVFAGLSLGTGLTDSSQFMTAGSIARWLFEPLASVGAAWMFYRLSIPRAAAWGDRFKGAFDLYRWKLLEQLGYGEWNLSNTVTERELWENISKRMLFGDPPVPNMLLPYSPEPILADPIVGTPEGCTFQLVRGVLEDPRPGFRRIRLTLRNTGQQTAEHITVLDEVAAGWDYVWGSEWAGLPLLTVTGANPYAFELAGRLAPGKSIDLDYAVMAEEVKPEVRT